MVIPKEQRRSTVIRQIRILGLSMLAVFAVGVVASASASAHQFFVCRQGGTEKYANNQCANKLETGQFSFLPVEGTEIYSVEGTGGVSKIETTYPLGGNPYRTLMECKKTKLTGKIEPEGKSSNTALALEECALYLVYLHGHSKRLEGCEVPNHISKPLKGGLVTGTGSGPEDQLEPQSGTTIFEFEVGRFNCILSGSYNVTGKQTCSLPESSVGKPEHEIACSPPGGSSLQVSGQPANLFLGTTAKLGGTAAGSAWGAE
jgi:hypothetical protein